MPEYQLVVCNRQGVPIDELPDATLDKVTWALTDMGSATITMKQNDSRVGVPLLLENEVQVYIESWPTALAAEVPWWGVWWRDKQTARSVTFECQTLESYLTKRFIDTASLYWADGSGNDIATEQFTIAWGLINYAQTGTDRNLYFTSSGAIASGKTRLRRYDRSEHPNILDALREFPNLVDGNTGTPNGFDWEIKGYRNGNRLWTPYYPQRGSLKADLALEFGRNLSDYDVDEDAVPLTTKTYNTGGSSGDTKIEANWRDDTASARFGEMTAIISTGEQKDPATLKDGARSYTVARNGPVLTPNVKAVRVPDELLGQVFPGDTLPVDIRNGRTNYNSTLRINRVTWVPGKNALDLEFVPKVT